MKTHLCLVATAVLALASAACEKDPNMNSQIFAGSAGTSGGTGTGGTAGSGSPPGTGPIAGTPVATFDTGLEGFAFDNFHDTNQLNLSDPASGVTPMLAFDNTNGSPTPGSAQVMAPYSGANQYVLIQKDYGSSNLQDWTGQTLHVRIKVTSGSFKGGAQVFVKTGSAFQFAGTYTNLAANSNWQEVTLNLTSPMSMGSSGMYNTAQIVEFGVELNSGSAGAGSGPVTFNVDSFSLSPGLPMTGSDAGSDAKAGAGGSGGGAGGATGTGGATGSGGASGSDAGATIDGPSSDLPVL
jgi:hypothetical protein